MKRDFQVLFADENGTVKAFEESIKENAQQAKRIGNRLIWLKLAELYFLQKQRLMFYPYPETFNENTPEDESPPVIKSVIRNTSLERLYRWGFHIGSTGNHRILYTVHNYHKVVLLHYLDKQYNGDIKTTDIQFAENVYFEYCNHDPSRYPITKG